jgi:hypothetical protein
MTNAIKAAAEKAVNTRYPDATPDLKAAFVEKLVELGGHSSLLDSLPSLVRAEAEAKAPKPFSAMNDAERQAEIERRFGVARAKMLESKYREYERALLAQENPPSAAMSSAEKRVAAGLPTSPEQRIAAHRATLQKKA